MFILIRTMAVAILAVMSAKAFGQSITGRITDRASGVALPDIDIDVFSLDAPSIAAGDGISDSSGYYTVDLPGAGQYIVRADPTAADGVADQYFGNVLLKSQATPVNVGATQDVVGISISLPRGVLMSGIVSSAATGLPLNGIDINLYASNFEFLASYDTQTLANGVYAIGAVPPGSYFVAANPDAALGQLYLETFYGGSRVIETAAPIVVASTNKSNLNIALAGGGAVSGTVNDFVTGNPVPGIDIDVFDSTGALVRSNGMTDALGWYLTDPVPAGDYFIRIDPSIAQGYAMTFYPSGLNVSMALPVHVSNGNVLTNINIVAPRGGSIGGTVLKAGALTPLGQIDMDLFDSSGLRVDVTAKTDELGAYVLGPVPAGSYVLRADPTIAQGFARTYFSNALAATLATPVGVVAGFETSNIDLALKRAGTISGIVRRASNNALLPGIDIDAFDAMGNRIDFNATTDSLGAFTLGPFPAGAYIVRADPAIGSGLAHQYFNQQIDVNFADPVTVTAAADTPAIDFSLLAGGAIAGVITNSGGAPVPGMDIDLFDGATGVRLRDSAQTAANGSYSFTGLNPGMYLLRVDPVAGQRFAMEYYNNKVNKASASPISVSGGTTTGSVNLSIAPGTEVGGKVFDAVTLAPVAGVGMEAFVAGTFVPLDQTALTAEDGTYQIPGLPLGNLLIAADPVSTLFYRTTYFRESPTAGGATVVAIPSTTPKVGINIALPSDSAVLRDEYDALDAAGILNGTLSYSEALFGIPTLSTAQFNAIDLNHDGSLTMRELLEDSSGPVGISNPVFVNGAYTGNELGTVADPFNTIREGATFVAAGGTVIASGGNYLENIRLAAPMRIESGGGLVSIGTFTPRN